LQELKRIVRVGGQVLVTVWAFEQERKKYTEQDVMVKWHLQKRFDPNAQQTGPTQKKRKKQRNAPVASSSTSSDSSTSDTVTTSSIKTSTVPDTQSNPATTAPVTETPSVVLDRYYHLFKKGELDELAIAAGGYTIVQSVWDVDNWYLLLERTE
jgi:tRNA (uracil-5-)-methyltransferase TRM9